MKNVVSTLATLVLLTLVSASVAFGQMAPPEAGAVMMGQFQARFGAEKSGPNLTGSVSGDAGGVVSTTVWMTSAGETVYALDVNSAEFQMPCGWAKQMEMPSLMDAMARGAIKRGLELGYTHIGPDCQNNVVDVYYPTCVTRSTGYGCPNLTAEAGSDYSVNGYQVCGEIQNPLITLVYVIRGQSICGDGANASLKSTESGSTSGQSGLQTLLGAFGLIR